MFFKSLKEKRRKELEQEISDYNQRIEDNEKLLEDIKNNYLPLRNKCEKVIRDKGLNQYMLRSVFIAAYDDDKLTVGVFDVEKDLWDGEERLIHGDEVLKETVQLRCFDRESYVAEQIARLKDPTKIIEHDIERAKATVAKDKARLNELDRSL